MARVQTNTIGLSAAVEATLGTQPSAGWFELEPNTISTFGATIATVARTPISRNRQREKGTTTDLDSAVEFETDLTLSGVEPFLPGFVFAELANRENTDVACAAVTAGGYTVAATGKAMKIGHLMLAEGFDAAANNGLVALTGAYAATGTSIPVSGRTAATGQAGSLTFTGFRTAAKPTWTWAAATKRATLALTGVGTGLNLSPGQVVHVGSRTSAGAIQNSLGSVAANDMYGFARVVSVAADSVVFDKVDTLMQKDSVAGMVAANVDLIFGQFARNVATDHADYVEKSFHFETTYPGLGAAGVDEYQYSKGNFCNTMAVALPLTDKATITFAFVGTDTGNVTPTRATGASAATDPTKRTAFNTTADIARLRVTETDESGLTTDFKSITLNFNNNVSPEKVVGKLGAAFMNTGIFEVGIETQVLFTSGDVIAAIRDNETVTMDFVLENDDGTIAVDLPSMTLGGGGREYPVNESVLINLTAQAFRDADLGYSIGVSLFPIATKA